MKLLQNISIRFRLRIVLALVALFSVLFCVFSIYQTNKVGNLVNELHDEPVAVTNASMNAYIDFTRNRDIVKGIILQGKSVISDTDEFLIEENQKALIENLDIIKGIAKDDVGRKLESQARALVIEWLDIRQEEFTLLRDGKAEGAMEIYNTRGMDQLMKIESVMNELNQYAMESADKFVLKARDYQKQGVLYLVIASLTGFGAVLVFVIFIISSIVSSVNLLKNTMNKGRMEGKFIKADLTGKNEISQMAESFNGLVEVLENRMWVEQGKNGFNSAVSGSMPVDEFAEIALSYIARYVEGASAVFYLSDESSGCLRLIGSYAFVERDHLSNEYRLGEGIIGQVAKEKRPILLKKTAETDGLVTSGIINTLPASIYAFPLVFNGKLYGVVEIFMLTALEKSKLNYLEDIGAILASSLHNEIQSERIRILLDESEKAKLELKKQAEEMQESNVQLEEQQQILNQQAEELQQANMQMEEQQQELQQMNLQLEEQKGMLDRQNRALIDRNRQMDLINHELDARTEELERAGRYKSELLANMSHELRTPLNSIILLSRLLSENSDSKLDEKDAEKAKVIHNAGIELLTLIDDILDLSKIEAGKMQVHAIKFDTSGFAAELRNMFKNLAEEKGLGYSVTDHIGGYLYNDRLKVTQIVRNFLSNAFKFTREGSIEVILDRDDTEKLPLRIIVKDTGIGISHDLQKRIFDAFYQANSSITREHGGVGLGLSISKELAHLIGGEIRMSSIYGKGSEFILLLPEKRDEAGSDFKHDEKVFNATLISNPDRKEVQDEHEPDIQSGKATVLVITGSHELQEKVRENALEKGLEVLMAEDGKAGIDKAERHKPSGIILDLNLPDVSGSRLLAVLKSAESTRGIPVYIVSEETPEEAGNGGNESDPLKPEVLEEIRHAVNSIIARDNRVTKQILIIEDNDVQRHEMNDLFEDCGLQVDYASDETEARYKINNGTYNAVVVDMMLGSGNGIDICRYIHENGPGIPVIVYTAIRLDDEQELEIRKVADSIILKTPNSYERLKEEISAFLNKLGETGNETRITGDKLLNLHCEGLKGKRILVVDDDAKNIFVMAAALENIGIKVGTAHNGREAIQKLRTEEHFDMVLMDIMMPVMDGYEAMRIIKNDERLKDIPIIAITARALKGDKEKALEAGADDYVSKPVDYEVLIRILNAWIDNVKAEK